MLNRWIRLFSILMSPSLLYFNSIVEHRVNSRCYGKDFPVKVTAVGLKKLLKAAFLHIIVVPVENVIGVVYGFYERLKALWFPGNGGFPGVATFKCVAEHLTDETCKCAVIDASGIPMMLLDEDDALRALL